MNSAIKVVSDVVASVEEDAPEPLSRVPELTGRIGGGDGRAWTRRLLDRAGTTEVSPFLKSRFVEAKPISAEEFTQALEELDQYRSDMLGFIQGYDAIICPTAAMPCASPWRDLRGQQPQCVLHGSVQSHRMARHRDPLRHVA